MAQYVNKLTLYRIGDVDAWGTAYGARLSGSEAQPPVSDQLISTAINDFRAFAADYLSYFESLPESEYLNKMTHSRLWHRATQAVDAYWSPLGEVAAQHLLEPYRVHLETGAGRAGEYLSASGIQLPGVLLYFNKVYSIRFLPYTRVAFAAVPYSHIARSDADWMSIPHELGHYLYWNLDSDVKKVVNQHEEMVRQFKHRLSGLPGLVERPGEDRTAIIDAAAAWWEEIFADVAGVRWGGVKFVDSFRTLLDGVEADPEVLTENDGTHPPLFMRPMLRQAALAKLGTASSEVDWPELIGQQFGLSFDDIVLRLPCPDPQNALSALTQETLMDLLLHPEQKGLSASTETIRLNTIDAMGVMEVAADVALETMDAAITAASGRMPNESAFQTLREFAEASAERSGRKAFEILLEPRVIEGGQTHTHGFWSHGKAHAATTHNH